MHKLAALLFLILPQTVAPQAPADAPRTQEIRREAKLAELVDEAAMQQLVRELCQLGPRMGGTASGQRSAEFIHQRFKALGLDARIVLDPPRWCHSESSWSVVAVHKEKRRTLASAWPYGFSPSAKGSARLSRSPGAGAALLTDKLPRRTKDTQPSPAVVLVGGNTTLDGSYPRISHLREGADNPAPVFGLSKPDAVWLDEALAAGEVQIEYALDAKIEEASPRTVVARLGARDSKAPPWTDAHLLFCAHGDSDAGGPGADDNASGIATLLGIASAYQCGIEAGIVQAPAREIRFAVWGSEIHSSKHLLSRGDQDGKVLAVLNYDQAGYGSGADQFNIEPDDLPANEAMARLLLGLLEDHGGKPGFPKQWATNKSLGGTDSYVFSQSELFKKEARPALTLFTSAWDSPAEHPRTPGMPGESWRERDMVNVDYDNFYHSAGDTPENTTDKEPWNMGWCARIGMLGARRFVDASQR